ncbi:MAG: anthranilate phosphoribosyltransferase [Clostridia bacterium]|jgi:anthranilate phosphoribosyltransferase|nr:anthranilate phosphoribosyltransferase [Clostridia bacterium]MDH7572329.1 anthranilate phosphoribosyltransferase [Clostridia bacterium]
MSLADCLARLVEGQDLDEKEAEAAMAAIMEGQATPAQIGAFLAVLRLKGETVAEITGFARAMRARALSVRTRHPMVVDTCGTGGDGAGTFNISTAAALVVAACGVPVAKHGNRSVSSLCGSADVLEELGIKVDLAPAEVVRCLEEVGFGFFLAPAFHPAMKHAAGPRKELGVRTVFNLLGPLCNPAGAPAQLVGVYDRNLGETVARVLGELGSRHALVVHGSDGLDEVTVTGSTLVAEWKEGRVTSYVFDPADLGIPYARPSDLAGGDARTNAALIRAVLEGEHGPRRRAVVLNAAFALVAAERAGDFREGMALAEAAIDSGRAREKLEELVGFSRQVAA